MDFDVEAARKAGYTDAEIADHLARTSDFDLGAAKKAGYTDPEVIAHLARGSALAPPKMSVLERMKEAFTGAQRRSDQTDALPDWAGMPELNSFSMASFKTGLGTLLSNPQETVQIIKSNFPGVKVGQDEKGNFLLTSSIDGKQYAIKPGFQASDVPRAAGAVAAFTPAGRATTIVGAGLRGAATQAVIEGTEAATGGDFDPGEVGAAGVLGMAAPVVGNVARATASGTRRLIERVRGGVAAADGSAGAAAPAAAPVAMPAATTGQGAADELMAAGGGTGAPAARAAGRAAADGTAGQSSAAMVWRSADGEVPVTFQQVERQAGPDGRMYARVQVDGRDSFVPADELMPASTSPARTVPPSPAADGARAATDQGVTPDAPSAPAAASLSPEELGQVTRRAAGGGLGSNRAQRILAQEAAPDPEVVASARRLGIEEYLQPDHVTTNQAFRELSQVLKSVPGSASGAAERDGLSQVAKRADDLITEIGGTHDLSLLDAGVKGRLQATQAELERRAEGLYRQVREAVPADSPAPATSTLEFIEQRARELGGSEFLSPMERRILARLAPRSKTSTEVVPGNPLMPGSMTDTTRKVVTPRQPSYSLLDDVRKDVGAVTKGRGPFKDADTGLAKKLYGLLSDDQGAVVANSNASELFDAARQAVSVRKGIEDDLVSLFGKQLDGSLVGNLTSAVGALPKGDASKLTGLLRAVPEDMRQQVMASGLNAAFGKSVRNGSLNFSTYANWYEGLLRNKQSYGAVMANLPAGASAQLRDLYNVSRAISKATRERITTGRLSEGMRAIEKQLEPADTLMGRVYEAAAKSSGSIAAEAFTSAVGMPGAGMAAGIASALRGGRKAGAFEAADKMLASPEFVRLARAGTAEERSTAATRLANTKQFGRFVQSLGSPVEFGNRERWLLQAMQAGRQESASTGAR